jgi:hypothetical protein
MSNMFWDLLWCNACPLLNLYLLLFVNVIIAARLQMRRVWTLLLLMIAIRLYWISLRVSNSVLLCTLHLKAKRLAIRLYWISLRVSNSVLLCTLHLKAKRFQILDQVLKWLCLHGHFVGNSIFWVNSKALCAKVSLLWLWNERWRIMSRAKQSFTKQSRSCGIVEGMIKEERSLVAWKKTRLHK